MDLPILIITAIILCAGAAAVIAWRRHARKNWWTRRAFLDDLGSLENAVNSSDEPSMAYRVHKLDSAAGANSSGAITLSDLSDYAKLKATARTILDDCETSRLWEKYRDAQTDDDKRSTLVALTRNGNVAGWMERTGKETTVEELSSQLNDLARDWLNSLFDTMTPDTVDTRHREFRQIEHVLRDIEGALTFWNYRLINTVAFPNFQLFAQTMNCPRSQLLQVAATAIVGEDILMAKWLFAFNCQHPSEGEPALQPIIGALSLYIAAYNEANVIK